jgi:hypothetical protein
MMNLRLLRLFAPMYRSFADDAGGGTGEGGSKDGAGSGADKTPPTGDAGGKKDGAESVTISKKDYDGLMGRLGQMEDADRRRQAADKKKADDEAIKRGEHEKLLAERDKEVERLSGYEKRHTERVRADHERRMKSIEKAPEAVRKLYRQPTAEKPLSLDDLEYNLAKLDEHEAIGIIGKAQGTTAVVVPAHAPDAPPVQVPGKERRPGLAW